MELPKNITQIGEADKSCKIYVEDYVMSYLKQMNRFAEDKEIAIALYGRCAVEQTVSYYFMYGACKLDFLQREVRHLSQAQNQEIERLRKKYFPECVFTGYLILNGEMIEGIHIHEQGICRYVKGYACFYEKNDNMLAYMLDNRREEPEPEVVEQAKYEQVKQRQEERRQETLGQETLGREISSGDPVKEQEKNNGDRSLGDIEKRMRGMRFAAASMFVLLCLVSVVTLQTEGMDGKLGGVLQGIIGNPNSREVSGQESVEAMGDDVIHTLVAEEQLAEAIRQENQGITENEAVAVQNSNVINSTQQDLPMKEEGTISETQADSTPLVEGQGITAIESVPTPEPQTEPVAEPQLTPVPEMTPMPELTPVPVITPAPTQAPTPEPPIASVQSEKVQNTYIIRSGDTLIGISNSLYGSESYVKEICKLNNISNPDNIQIGQKILLP